MASAEDIEETRMSPSREDWERWLAGEEVEGMPSPWKDKSKKAGNVDLEKVASARPQNMSGARFRVIFEDKLAVDAELFFGKYQGKKLSEIVEGAQGYLQWMLTVDFPEQLKMAVNYVLATHKLHTSMKDAF